MARDRERMSTMKVCPVCSARCFEDMEVCYGCMHRFEEKPDSASEGTATAPLARLTAVPEPKKGEAVEVSKATVERGHMPMEIASEAFSLEGARGGGPRWELVVSLRPVCEETVEGQYR